MQGAVLGAVFVDPEGQLLGSYAVTFTGHVGTLRIWRRRKLLGGRSHRDIIKLPRLSLPTLIFLWQTQEANDSITSVRLLLIPSQYHFASGDVPRLPVKRPTTLPSSVCADLCRCDLQVSLQTALAHTIQSIALFSKVWLSLLCTALLTLCDSLVCHVQGAAGTLRERSGSYPYPRARCSAPRS